MNILHSHSHSHDGRSGFTLRPVHWLAMLALGLALAMVAMPAGAQGTDPAPTPPSGTENPGTASPDSLTETMEKTDGVIKPPPVGAPAVVPPPADAGRTPVIAPNDPTEPGDDTIKVPEGTPK